MLSWLNVSELEFRNAWFLWTCLLAPVVYWLSVQLPTWVCYSSLSIVDRAPSSLRTRLRFLPALLLSLASLALAIALSGPRTGDATTKVKREGISIMLVLDRSGSMDARDFVEGDYGVSRLDAVKSVLRRFVLGGDGLRGRPNDLVGLVVFGTYADALVPLTLDHGSLVSILDDVHVAVRHGEAATAVGEGLGLAVERLLGTEASSKVVVLLTDGVNNAGQIDPRQAAELAANYDIRVYTVGAGRTGVAPLPVQTSDGQTVLRAVPVEIDETTLKDIAQRTGGRYFNARDANGLIDTYREIDRLERTELTEIRYLQYREHYPLFLLTALSLILLSGLVAGTFSRTLP